MENYVHIIEHYNKTKSGTDTFDQLCKLHTVARATKRWPVRFLFGMLDQAIVNSRILHISKLVAAEEEEQKKKTARECYQQVAFIYLRLDGDVSLRQGTRKGIEKILNINQPSSQNDSRPVSEKHQRCALCPRKDDHKTQALCPSCMRAMCDKHRIYMCYDCGGVE
ncbi:Protein of unknown function [Cotesia congregata]|uniref:PiggyBac transposable element-derived protein domain-containing protein n=1 Tax=Cotesia congregata TaxID=51543 RepID=A0A8J2MNF9_COTCN|nr:Protein of unknown function [Cotesia congregata]